MSKIEILQALHNLTSEEKLEVIEVASRLLRQNLTPKTPLSLPTAAEIMKPFYQQGSELSQWTDQDPEDFSHYPDYA
jgi:hypothetical protein